MPHSRRRRRRQPTTMTPVLKALKALPQLVAAIEAQVAGRHDTKVEVLPGHPTTVIFTVGEQQGMLIVPLPEAQVRHLLHLPQPQPRNRGLDQLWELDRRDLSQLPS